LSNFTFFLSTNTQRGTQSPIIVNPVVTVQSVDDVTDTAEISTDTLNDGNYYFGLFAEGAAAPAPGAGGTFTPAAIEVETAAVPVSNPSTINLTFDSGVAGTAYRIWLFQETAAGGLSDAVSIDFTANVPSGAAINSITADPSGIIIDYTGTLTIDAPDPSGVDVEAT